MSRILIVDDEENIRFVLAQALRKEGYDVFEAGDGDEALKMLEGQAVDLVVTDLLMPNREGLETIMEIQMNWPQTKIIAMSGGGRVKNTDFLSVAHKLGAKAVMKKPFSMAKFRDTVARVINEDTAKAAG